MSDIAAKNTAYRDALPIGTVLNGYTIRSVLGRGGFGVTYLATDQLEQTFAIKEYFPRQFATRHGLDVVASSEPEQVSFDDCRARFLAEAKTLCQLGKSSTDDGVVRVFTFFEANGTAYIVMEYLSGESLEDMLNRAPTGLPEPQILAILQAILKALDRIHEAGIVHRDIKPANIFINENGRPVLIDFGSARVDFQQHGATYTQIYSGRYAPMEQVAGLQQGPFSDVYAIGMTAYRAIGGHGIEAFTRQQAVMRTKPDPMITARDVGAGRYSEKLLTAIDQAVAISPDDRPQTAGELLTLLQSPEGKSSRLDNDATMIQPRAPIISLAASALPGADFEMLPASAKTKSAKTAAKNAMPPGAVVATAAQPRQSLMSRTTLIVIILVLAIGGAAAAIVGPNLLELTDEQAWAKINASPSLVRYEKYLQRYPHGVHREAAQTAVNVAFHTAATERAAATWAHLRDSNSVQEIRAFIPTAPDDSQAVAEARARLVLLQQGDEVQAKWQAVSGTNDPAALRQFIADYGNTNYGGKASTALQELVWTQTHGSLQAADYEAFLRDFPNSPHVAEARQMLQLNLRREATLSRNQAEADAWQQAQNTGSPAAIKDFLTAYPNGPHAVQARAELSGSRNRSEAEAWQAIENSTAVEPLQNFLAAYPNGPHSAQARAELAARRKANPTTTPAQDHALENWVAHGRSSDPVAVIPIVPQYQHY